MNIIEKQLQEFDEKFYLATIINDGVNLPYVSCKGAQTSSVGNLLYEIKDFLRQSMVLAMEEALESVEKELWYVNFNGNPVASRQQVKTKHNEVLDKYRNV